MENPQIEGKAGGEESRAEYQIGKHPVFPLERLQMLLVSHGYTSFCTSEEDARCAADLMYRLFKRPEGIVDELLTGFAGIIRTKYSPDLHESRVITDALDFLLKHPRAEAKTKLFYILWIVANEEEAQTVIKAGYKPDNMWGEKWETHFKTFLKELKALVSQLQHTAFGEPNVCERMDWFNAVAEMVYMSQ
jgi:hypothetical protein